MRTYFLSLMMIGTSACSVNMPEQPDPRDCDERGLFFRDSDGDGFGADDAQRLACEADEGWSDVGGDCDDTDSAITTECHEFDTGQDAGGDTSEEEPEDTGGGEDTQSAGS